MKGKIDKINIKDRDCYVYTPCSYGEDNDRRYPVIYCNDGDIMMKCFDEIADNIEDYFDNQKESECIIVMIPPVDRNKEYTPWKSRNPFNKELFYGNADEYIIYLVNSVKEKINSSYRTKQNREYNYLLGYSLGGLVSLYTMFRCNDFMKSCCISSSLWYENWDKYIKSNEVKNKDSEIFLYLGENESKSRNAVLKTVLDRTKETYDILKCQLDDKVKFTVNEGGHFNNVPQRYAEGIKELCSNKH